MLSHCEEKSLSETYLKLIMQESSSHFSFSGKVRLSSQLDPCLRLATVDMRLLILILRVYTSGTSLLYINLIWFFYLYYNNYDYIILTVFFIYNNNIMKPCFASMESWKQGKNINRQWNLSACLWGYDSQGPTSSTLEWYTLLKAKKIVYFNYNTCNFTFII